MVNDRPAGDMFTGRLWAVIPVKDLRNAKQRLSPALSRAERTGLYRAMLLDVLTVMSKVERIAGIMIVSKDEEVRVLTAPFGVEILKEPANDGHSMAVARAAARLADAGAQGLLQVPGDIPLVSVDEIDTLIDARRESPSLVIAPSLDRRGSNAMLTSPPDVIAFNFGDDSFYPHLEAARAVGIEPVVVESPGLGLDIDTPEDLEKFCETPSDTHAYAYLSNIR